MSAEELGELLTARRMTIALSESCTGGLLASTITDVPGSSLYFLGGIIAYSNDAKVEVLGVPEAALATHGAVSSNVALAMAYGALDHFASDLGLAVTGIAGPAGGSEAKPVGTVFIAVVTEENEVAREFHFSGSRTEIKQQSVDAAMKLAREFLNEQ